MLKHADALLKLALALAALLAGGGVGFYYGIYLPAQDVRSRSEELVRQQSQAREQTDQLAARARREEAAQTVFQDCVSTADLTYKSHWTAACRAQHDADVAAYEDCADDFFSTEAGCHRKHPIRPERDCALTTQLAERLVAERQGARQQCQAALQAAQQN
ncbi:hypothetical protein MTR62_06060 [Novosphingobium sp. 1949]|uniref:Lysozyme inhibitor LprI N-terminal domain-containing protein n=1 Tax=Novosphingobium organovorum TaxID=2930092 RepID=A0ABT0BBK1_9SPHN|nr:hypothetical protein [Novosphingobium organovorum]MCJ2182265.1 hypothetical protein [Novosphingobium organovorum]